MGRTGEGKPPPRKLPALARCVEGDEPMRRQVTARMATHGSRMAYRKWGPARVPTEDTRGAGRRGLSALVLG